ncbi:hypothetical protein DSM106972_039270 [Dulcicalothrix desertica PCC 7102]|uniref:Uncharacterized protein n=1 Tax=Dulcicalothrix desertica PCC 7102 TaxID=232991 RepID=A0A3S1D7S2_9CYAN|nr:hypothetical protein DSM106972_039270 [Dulcicalothrix desertica PCC 7102]
MLATSSTGAEQRTVLHNISWETFEALLRETGSGRGSRFAYEDGTLEIMAPLFAHENLKIQFRRFIVVIVEETNRKGRKGRKERNKRNILQAILDCYM